MKNKLVILANLFVLILVIQISSVSATEINVAPKGIPFADSGSSFELLNDGIYPPLPYVEAPPWVFPFPSDESALYAPYNFFTDYGTVPRWIGYDFGTNYDITRVVLLPYVSSTGYPHYYPIDYEVQKSDDGTNWEKIISVTGNNYPVIDQSFPTASARFIRIYVTKAYPAYPPGPDFRLGATEFEVFASLDNTPPAITITGDNPITVEVGSTYADAGATATDDVDGSVSVTTTGTVNTATVGTYTITYTATDSSLNTATSSRMVYVRYAPAGGMCLDKPGHEILQPINKDGNSVFKKGSTVPAKFRVCDSNGNSMETPDIVSSFKLILISGTVVNEVDEDVVSTTPDTAFRWDPTSQQWIFNLNTKNLIASNTYNYRISLNDGTSIDFSFGLK